MNMEKEIKYWKDLSNDPNDQAVRQFLRDTLLNARQGRVEDINKFLCEFVRNHSVLDIGVVGHTIDRSLGGEWRHDMIKNVASHVVGVDILEDEIKQLCARGYDVRFVDATSENDLGDRFDRIVIGDVIEHVDNPVALLRFAARHLEPSGRILCSTPNPLFIGHVIDGLRDGLFIPNAEHVTWITPTMALELAHRANLTLNSYWHIQGKGHSLIRRSVVKALMLTGMLDSEIFAGAFYYIFERP